eukprot:Amastigsp_a840999_94.p3 type:complete len:120 gc:universal Amastigsp_a840999_94:1460-1819(+)
MSSLAAPSRSTTTTSARCTATRLHAPAHRAGAGRTRAPAHVRRRSSSKEENPRAPDEVLWQPTAASSTNQQTRRRSVAEHGRAKSAAETARALKTLESVAIGSGSLGPARNPRLGSKLE